MKLCAVQLASHKGDLPATLDAHSEGLLLLDTTRNSTQAIALAFAP